MLPVQAAVLGINAHINADLARVAARSIRNRDPAKVARYKLDYDRINDILVACLPGVIGQLAAAHACPVARVAVRAQLAERATIGVVMPLIRSWRERAWADAFRLLSSHEPERLAAAFDRRAAMQARVLALSVRRPAARVAPEWRPAAAAAA